MTRTARTRSRVLRGSFSGSCVRTYPPNPTAIPPQTYTYTSGNLKTEYCEDWVGLPRVDSSLNVKLGVAPRISLSGIRTQSGLVFTSTEVPLSATPQLIFQEPWRYESYFGRTPINDAALTQMALANMNPNRPDIDLTVSIAELRELPELLRDATHILTKLPGSTKHSARANIVAQFGMAPIIRDVLTLFKFAELVDKREKYLRELSSGFKRIKRKLTEEEWDGIAPIQTLCFGAVPDESSTTNRCIITSHAKRRYWFTARAKLVNPISEREIRSISKAVSSGTYTLTAQQLWNLVPWSWLVDWFSTTGDLLAAYRGGLKWQWEGLNLMYETTYYMTMQFPNPRSGFTITPLNPNAKATVKIRRLPAVSVYPQWRIPYLTFRQVSILLSLAILRV